MFKIPDSVSPELLEFLQKFLLEERISRFDEILNKRTRHITIALENLVDTHNTNAVLRSCECFGVQDVHIIDNGASFKPAKNVLRGAQKWLTIHQYKSEENNTLSCIRSLRNKGYRIIATSPHESKTTIDSLNIDTPLAVFLGQEHAGVSELIKQEADEFVIIPMQGFTESFNISVAAAIILYELTKRLRQNNQINWKISEDEKYQLRSQWTIKSIYRPELIIQRYLAENKK